MSVCVNCYFLEWSSWRVRARLVYIYMANEICPDVGGAILHQYSQCCTGLHWVYDVHSLCTIGRSIKYWVNLVRFVY